jgi:hypothetical protein
MELLDNPAGRGGRVRMRLLRTAADETTAETAAERAGPGAAAASMKRHRANV